VSLLSFIANQVALCLSLLAWLSPVAASAQTLKLASKMPADSPEGKVFQYFADQVKQLSDGKVTVQVYPSEQLGKDAAVLEQLQLGTVHFFVDSAFFMQRWVPDIKWISASFVFDDREHWKRFMGAPLARGWFEQVEKQAGIAVLGNVTDVVRGPYRVIVSKKPIRAADDVKGLKLRMYPDQLATSVWTSLGAETRVLAFTETYESIKSGVVDSVTVPIAMVESMRFTEVAPVITRTDEFWQEIAFMMNARAFKKLAPAAQEALLKAHKAAGEYSVKLMNETADQSLARMRGHGVQVSELDRSGLVKRARAFYDTERKAGHVPAGFFEAVEAARKP
jgi:tripartite ATP-independent transporter DctP family solute receptor